MVGYTAVAADSLTQISFWVSFSGHCAEAGGIRSSQSQLVLETQRVLQLRAQGKNKQAEGRRKLIGLFRGWDFEGQAQSGPPFDAVDQNADVA